MLPTNPICHVDDVYNGILVNTDMLGRALFYGAGAGKLPTASAVVADILDILSGRSTDRRLPRWQVANENDVADASSLSCRRVYVFEGCPRCEAKAKNALASENSVWITDGKFAVISSKMTATDADAAIASTGLCPILSLPVLE